MKKLRKFLEKTGMHMPHGCQQYLWKCFGENCVISDVIHDNMDPRDAVIDVVYSNVNVPRIYEVTVMFNDITFIYIDPEYYDAYISEAESKNIDWQGSSNVYEIDDYIPTQYCDYDTILRVINMRKGREYFKEDEDWPNLILEDDNAQNEDWPFPVEDIDKSFNVVLSLDLLYNVTAISHKDAIYKAKCILIDQLDIQPNNFQLTNERVILNNGEV